LLLFAPLPTPPRPTLFPYTTLFRSLRLARARRRPRRRRRPQRLPALLVRRPRLGQRDRPASGSGRLQRDLPDRRLAGLRRPGPRSEEHTSELQSRENLVCRLLLEKK